MAESKAITYQEVGVYTGKWSDDSDVLEDYSKRGVEHTLENWILTCINMEVVSTNEAALTGIPTTAPQQTHPLIN